MSRLNSVPDFTEDLQSMSAALRAMKEVVEGLTGQRRNQGEGAPHVFLQLQRPDPRTGTQVRKGDFWIQPEQKTLHFWDGRLWQRLVP